MNNINNSKYDILFQSNVKRYNSNLKLIQQLFNTKLKKNYKEMVLFIFNKYKQKFNDQYSLYIIVIYSLMFLELPIKDYIKLTNKDQISLSLLINNFIAEKNNDYYNIIKTYLDLGKRLFYFKLLIKYTIVLRHKNIIKDLEYYQYCLNLGILIPLINYYNIKGDVKKSIEDKYFKTKFPKKYKEIDNYINKTIGKKEVNEEIINKINDILFPKEYTYNIYIRKKSHFSIYGKILRKKNIKDIIGVKILFKNNRELNFFEKKLHKYFNVNRKKDFYLEKSQYSGIHLNISLILEGEIIDIEMQLRTIKEEKNILLDQDLNHFKYSIKNNKFNPIFGEIDKSIKIIKKIYFIK